jgi:hypothetical protein
MMVVGCDGVKYVSALFICRTTSDLILHRIRINQCQAKKIVSLLGLLVAPTHTHTNSYSIRCSLRINDFREYDYLLLFSKRFNLCYHRFQNRFSFRLQI